MSSLADLLHASHFQHLVVAHSAPQTILGLESSAQFLSLALYHQQAIVAYHQFAEQGHSGLILQVLDELLAVAGVAHEEIACLAFGNGPGAFTGLRIAAAVTQGLAFAWNKPVQAIGSLQILAQQILRLYARETAQSMPLVGQTILACSDARMGEVYAALYATNATGWLETLRTPTLLKPAAMLDWLATVGDLDRTMTFQPLLLGGNGLSAQPQIMSDLQNAGYALWSLPATVPMAQDLVMLVAHSRAYPAAVSAEHAQLLYVRDKIALTTAERTAAKSASLPAKNFS